MFQEAVDFVLKGLNGAVDVLTDLNTVAPIIGISLVGFLILTVVSRLILPIIGGTLPSGMSDDISESKRKFKKAKDQNSYYKKSRAEAYANARDLRKYDRRYMNRKDN